MSGRDHSEQCPTCGVWFGGLDGTPCNCPTAQAVKVADRLVLREYDPDRREYTGRQLERVVTYVTDFSQAPGWVVLSIAVLHPETNP